MIVPTAPALEGSRIVDHAGLALGEASACAAVAVDLNYAALGERGSMLMVRVPDPRRPSSPQFPPATLRLNRGPRRHTLPTGLSAY